MDENDLKRARISYTEWKALSGLRGAEKSSALDKWLRRHKDFIEDLTNDICKERPELRKLSIWRVIQIIKEENGIVK